MKQILNWFIPLAIMSGCSIETCVEVKSQTSLFDIMSYLDEINASFSWDPESGSYEKTGFWKYDLYEVLKFDDIPTSQEIVEELLDKRKIWVSQLEYRREELDSFYHASVEKNVVACSKEQYSIEDLYRYSLDESKQNISDECGYLLSQLRNIVAMVAHLDTRIAGWNQKDRATLMESIHVRRFPVRTEIFSGIKNAWFVKSVSRGSSRCPLTYRLVGTETVLR